ncbi:M16 family metallopeptidase [Hyalangium gracile]|uniref:M16 family metallopeptidase n=1 Tax=Hyalangium gracile TaxID=394092 RepID=UPI001CCC305A|nr:insulinase family protein [Hyalangium gracile]
MPTRLFESRRSKRPRAFPGLLLLLTLALSACATMLPERGKVVMRDVNFPLRDFRLPSGLRVVVEEDRRSPVVALVALVGSGSSSDPAGKEGLAHVVEHLAFRARHGGSASVWTRLERMGAGRFNAATSLDHTLYQTLVPREALTEMLQLEAQRLAAPLAGVTEEVFAVEREVVRNELRQSNETGYFGQIFHWVQEASFPAGHPYARPVIGSHESLSRLSLADAQRFVRKHYQPENVTLVITGDVDLAAMDAMLKERLPEAWHGSGLPLAVSPRLAQPAPEPPLAPAAPKLVSHEAAVPSPELYLSWVLPRGFDEESALQAFMRSSLESELGRAMMTDGDIAGFSTGVVSGTRASLLIVRVVLITGAHPEKSAEAMLDQVFGVWDSTGGAGDALAQTFAYQRLHRSAVMGMALDAEDLLERALSRAELTHFTLDARSYGRTQAALASIGSSKMTEYAYHWLQRDRARMILVKPGANGVAALSSIAGLPPDEAEVEGPKGPLPAALSSPAQITSVRLANGMEVLLAPRPGMPLVSVGVALGGGEAIGKRGVAELAEWVSFPRSDFQGGPGDYGLRSSRVLYRDHLRYRLQGAAGNVGNILAILSERLSSMVTEYAVLRFYHENVLPWRKALDSYPEEKAQRALQRALYGAHPYGQVASSEEMGQVTQSDVEDWLAQVHRPANAVVVISGEFEPQQVMPLVHHYLGGWGGRGGAVESPSFPPLGAPSARPELLITPRPGATQGHLQLACRLPEVTPEAGARYALMAAVLRRHLWHEVREQMGATYGFHTQVSMARGGAAHLLLEGVVDAPQLGATMTAVRSALLTYARDGVPAAELESARSGLLAEQAVGLTTSGAWVNALLNARVLGWDVAAVTGRPALLQAVSEAELRKEFAGCAERLVVGVIGDEGQARAAAQAAFP